MNQEELLGEVEDIMRTMPPQETLDHDTDDNFAWFRRVSAFVEAWSVAQTITLEMAMRKLKSRSGLDFQQGFSSLMILLHQARNDLRMKTIGPVNEAVGLGKIFDYFDEIRKIIEPAKQDILFVDPYLDAEFVSRYLPQIKSGVSVRLLTRKGVHKLLPAVDLYSQQSGATVLVRSAPGFHDRYVLIDRTACYQSGA